MVNGLMLTLALLQERRRKRPDAVPMPAVDDEIAGGCDEDQTEKVDAWLEVAMKGQCSTARKPKGRASRSRWRPGARSLIYRGHP